MVWFLYGTIEPDVVHVNQDIFIICFYEGFCHEVFNGSLSQLTYLFRYLALWSRGFMFWPTKCGHSQHAKILFWNSMWEPGFNVSVFFCHCWNQSVAAWVKIARCCIKDFVQGPTCTRKDMAKGHNFLIFKLINLNFNTCLWNVAKPKKLMGVKVFMQWFFEPT